MIKGYVKFITESNEGLTKGDAVELKYSVEEDPDDGDLAYSIDKGEVGEVRYVVGDRGETQGRPENIVYMIKFPDKNGKRRLIQLTAQSLIKK